MTEKKPSPRRVTQEGPQSRDLRAQKAQIEKAQRQIATQIARLEHAY
jgi:hypothetical protein